MRTKKNKNIKNCIACGEPIHPKRLEILPNAKTCVNCSTTGKKGGVTITKGEGDHTYNETIIMEPDEFQKYQELEARMNKGSFTDTVHPDDETDEEENSSEGENIIED